MNLCFNRKIIESYTSPSQQIRILTEDWVNKNGYCPNCGSQIQRYPNNKPVADFFCDNCQEEYELRRKARTKGQGHGLVSRAFYARAGLVKRIFEIVR